LKPREQQTRHPVGRDDETFSCLVKILALKKRKKKKKKGLEKKRNVEGKRERGPISWQTAAVPSQS